MRSYDEVKVEIEVVQQQIIEAKKSDFANALKQ
jgi:hypothetical protein